MRTITRFGLGLLVALFLGATSAQENNFVYQVFGGVDSLDPAQAYDTASGIPIENIYETLYDYNQSSVTDHVPTLATSFSTNEAGDVFTFELREGVTFHSGNEFTCADVEYSMNRALVHNPADSGIWFLAESFLPTDQNADAYLGEDATDEEYAEYWANIDGAVECVDDYTVQYNLDGVDPTFFVKMMSNPARIVDRDFAIEGGLWDGTQDTWREWIGVNLREYHLHDQASGTGAYELVDWDGQTVVAERFDGYWGETPDIQNVVIEQVDEQSTRLLAIQAGDADRVQVGDRATLEQIRGAEGVTIHEDPSWVSTSVGTVFFNQDITMQDNPDVGSGEFDGDGIPADFFADENTRKCFAYNFDQTAFIEQVLQGQGQALTMALPPSFLGYNEDLPIYDLDFEAAEEACRAAHDGALWENGFEFTATYNAGNTTRQAALEIIKDNIEFMHPDFRMNVRSLSWPDFLAHTDSGSGTMFVLGWAPSYADSDYFLHPYYHSDGYFTARTGYDNPEMDALIERGRQIVDMEERAEIYNEVGRIAAETMPVLPYPSATEFIVTRDNVEGVYLNPMYSGDFLWKDIVKN